MPKLPQNFPRFLAAKQLFTKSATEFKKLLKEFWFTLYSRGNRILGSRLEQDKFCDFQVDISGFEHVFLGEKKLGKVQVRNFLFREAFFL